MTTGSTKEEKFTPGQLVKLYPTKMAISRLGVSLRSTQDRSKKFVPKGTMVMFLRDAGGGDQAFVLFEEKNWLVKMKFMRPCKRPAKLYG